MRAAGFYWVRFGSQWEIAEFCETDDGKGCWVILGRELDIPGDELVCDEIGEQVKR